jgi:outer membrane protein, heavy metal efflux system
MTSVKEKTYKFLVFVGLISSSLTARGEVLTLNNAIATAYQNNPQVKAALSQVKVANAEEIIAGAVPSPAIVTDNGIRSEKTYRFLGLEGTIELGGKRSGRIKVAESISVEALIEAQKRIRDVHIDVHKAYAELSVTQEQLRLAQERAAITKKVLEQTEVRNQFGDSSGLDFIRISSTNDLSQIDLQRAQTNLNKARIRLNALLNFPQDKVLETENIEELKPVYELHQHPQLAELKNDSFSNRLELALIGQRKETQEATMSLARRAYVPDLTLAVGPSKQVGEPFGAFVTGRMTLPFFGTARGEIAKAQAQLRHLQIEELSTRNQIESEVNQAYQELEMAEETYFSYKDKLLNQAAELEKMVDFGVQKGAFRLTDLFALQNETKQLREKYLQTLLEYQFALAALERAVGKPFVGRNL